MPGWFIGEFFGTSLLVFFGCGSVCAAVLTSAQVGIFRVAIVWGLGIAMAIFLTGSLSGAHINPAVTIGLAAWAGFPKLRMAPYIAAQMLGAFVASDVPYLDFSDALRAYQRANGILRGGPGSEATAMLFGEFYPNPSGKPLTDVVRARMSAPAAFVAEVIGTP